MPILRSSSALALDRPFNLFAFYHMSDGIAEPDGAADAARGHRVIAGHHDDADAGSPAVLDGMWHIGARRVLQADKADEGQIFVRWRVSLAARLHGAGDDAQAVMTEILHMGTPFGAMPRYRAAPHPAPPRSYSRRRAPLRARPSPRTGTCRHGGAQSPSSWLPASKACLSHYRAVLQQRRTLEPDLEARSQ